MELIDITIFSLEMFQPHPREIAVPQEGLEILPVTTPTVRYYRFLYDAIGEDYRWLSRRKMTDDQLREIIQHAGDELFVLHWHGTPAGMAELDFRSPEDVELVQFGILPEFHGKGLGTWFLNQICETVWQRQPKRFWLHTCTLDHPAALTLYEKAGFVRFKEENVRREW